MATGAGGLALRYLQTYPKPRQLRWSAFIVPTTEVKLMAPARAGSFNANFSPETLESFKSLCRDQSRQYTKVLERLAELYLGSQGSILDTPEENLIGTQTSSPEVDNLAKSVEQLETATAIYREDFEEIVSQLKSIEARIKKLESNIVQ